jgi:drug/metabolite transporter (DMT)-like permease
VSTLTPVVYAFGIDVARLAIVAPFALATRGARSAVSSEWRVQRRAILAIGVLTPAAYMMVLGALASAPVSYVAPAREISILFGAALGLRFLKESYPAQRLSGAIAIVAGVLALALG